MQRHGGLKLRDDDQPGLRDLSSLLQSAEDGACIAGGFECDVADDAVDGGTRGAA